MSADRLQSELVGLAQRLSSGTYELLVLVGELDARGTWAIWGALSCAAWLADTCDIELCTARTQVRVARALREHSQLDTAMRNGEVSYAKARVLVPYLNDGNVEALVELAEITPAGRLGAAIAAWSQRNDDPETIAERQHEARSVSWRTEPDGTVTLTARLAPSAAGAVCAVIDAQVTRSDAPTGASLAQQRADALARLVTAAAATSPPRWSSTSVPTATPWPTAPHYPTTPSPPSSPKRSCRCSCTTADANPSTQVRVDASPPADSGA